MNEHSHKVGSHDHNFSGETTDMSNNSKGMFNTRRSDIIGGAGTIDCSGNISRGALFTAYRSDSGAGSSIAVNYAINVEHHHTYGGVTTSTAPSCSSTTSTGSFTGTAGTTKSTGGDTNNKTVAFPILPPYVVKYCWERTA